MTYKLVTMATKINLVARDADFLRNEATISHFQLLERWYILSEYCE